MARATLLATNRVVGITRTTRFRRTLFYLLFFLLWDLVAHGKIWPDYVFPAPLDVLSSLLSGIQQGLFINAALVSLKRLALGYGISLGIGVLLGVLIGRFRLIEQTLGSLVLGLQTLPSVCWLPLALLWLGLNEQAVIFVVVMGAVFSITLGVEAGVKNTSPVYLKAARTLGTHGLALYTQVIFPAAMPTILAGLKQGWSFAWRSLLAGELLYVSLSLGNLLQTARDFSDVAQLMAVMVVIIFLGVAIDSLIFAPLERLTRERWGL